MYADHTPLEAAGQALIAFLFLGTALINSTMKAKQHADRIAAQGIPVRPGPCCGRASRCSTRAGS